MKEILKSKVSLYVCALLFSFLYVNIASAAFVDPAVTQLCNAIAIFQGNVAKSMAAFAVIALGVMLFLGKITWGTVFAIGLGLFAIFGSITIVGALTGGFTCATA